MMEVVDYLFLGETVDRGGQEEWMYGLRLVLEDVKFRGCTLPLYTFAVVVSGQGMTS